MMRVACSTSYLLPDFLNHCESTGNDAAQASLKCHQKLTRQVLSIFI
jgi:hypothetical protein